MANPITNTEPTGLLSDMGMSQALGVAGVGAIAYGLVVAGCLASAGVACPVLTGLAVVAGSAAGGGLGAWLNGGDDEDIEDGIGTGLVGGLGGAAFIWWA